MHRTGGAYSSVDEIVLPVNEQGHYDHEPGKAFGPDKIAWSYAAPRRIDFYAPFISGAQRLGNGNTLICSGTNGTVFEVTPKNEIVWKYVNPDFGSSPPGGGTLLAPAPRRLGQILSPFVQRPMNLTTEQKKQLKNMQEMARAFQAAGVRGGFGPPGGGGVFRAPRYGASYAGLIGKDLRPGKTIEEMLQANLPKQSQDR